MNMHLDVSFRQRWFTLIELLVVIAVVLILVSMLLPALSTARERGKRILCLGNLHQSALSTMLYAEDNNATMPEACPATGRSAPVFLSTDVNWDLRPYIAPYIGSFEVWRCPSVPELAPIDDPRNTRFACYGNFEYYAGRFWPQFGDPTTKVPDKLNLNNASDQVLMQDQFSTTFPGNAYAFVVNHSRDGELWLISKTTNPSGFARHANSPYGANVQFFDGHARWYGMADLQNVGNVSSSGLGRHTWSRMP